MKKLMFFLLIGVMALSVNAQTKTAMKVADLKKEITDYVTKTYPAYKISEAFKVETNKVITYQVLASKEASKITLVFNESGAFVKKEMPKVAQGSKTGNKPASTNKEQGTKTTTQPKN